MINLTSFVAYHARRAPGREAMLYAGERITYGDLIDRAERVAGWLQGRGIGPGAVVAVLMKNSAAFIELALGTSHCGAVFLPINFRLSADEVAYIVENSGARLLLVDLELEKNAAGPAPVVVWMPPPSAMPAASPRARRPCRRCRVCHQTSTG